MQLNILAFAVPLFVSFMILEYVVAKRKKLPYFNLHHSITNISVGIAERLLDVWVVGIFYFVYDYIQKHYGLFEIKPGLLLWILLLLCTDFTWYWYHRLAHEINIFWAAHIVHHQSEDFNYTVSARITVMQAFVRTGFWCVLPFLGFPATMITGILLVHGLYPFFIHTRLIGKLGILEYILVTPSHHRVHHASNEQYLDKNYGDVFIIWDKLFGTFQKEEDNVEIQYGLTHPLKSYSFLWQHFHFLAELTYAVRDTKGIWNKCRLLVSRPELIDPAMREIAEERFRIRQSNAPFDKPLNRYVVWQIGLTITLLFIFILFGHYISLTEQMLISVGIILTLINCGAIMEQKQWIYYLEFFRLLTFTTGLLLVYPAVWLNTLFLLTAILLLAFFDTIRTYYLGWVYHRHRHS